MSKQSTKEPVCPACGSSSLICDDGMLTCSSCGFRDYVYKEHTEDLDEGLGKGG